MFKDIPYLLRRFRVGILHLIPLDRVQVIGASQTNDRTASDGFVNQMAIGNLFVGSSHGFSCFLPDLADPRNGREFAKLDRLANRSAATIWR